MLPQDASIQAITEQMVTLAPRTNLFTSLSVPFIGIPVLMIGTTPENTPLATQVIELVNPLGWLGLFLLFSVIGVLITAVYYVLIAQTIQLQEGNTILPAVPLVKRMATTWLKLLGLGVIIFIFAVIIYVPLLIMSFVAALISQALATGVLFIGPILILWMLVFTFFVPFDLSLHGSPLHLSVKNSIQMVQLYFTPMLGLLIIILLIRNILGSLLLYADDGSWLTAVGILGHAFVMTSLITAVFIFFRDRHALLINKQQMIVSE